MNIVCSVCGGTTELKVVQSRFFKGARFVGCESCRTLRYEPRPILVIAARFNDDNKPVLEAIKRRLYIGSAIEAEEIIP